MEFSNIHKFYIQFHKKTLSTKQNQNVFVNVLKEIVVLCAKSCCSKEGGEMKWISRVPKIANRGEGKLTKVLLPRLILFLKFQECFRQLRRDADISVEAWKALILFFSSYKTVMCKILGDFIKRILSNFLASTFERK